MLDAIRSIFAPVPPSAPVRRTPAAAPVPKARVRVEKKELAPIDWDASPVPEGDKITLRNEAAPLESSIDPMARRIRDRYIAARFSGVIQNAEALADPAITIKAARLYFEDGLLARAHELLDLATNEHPSVAPLWLAALEISFLARDPDRYVKLAHGFHVAHPESPDWAEVVRMGRNIAPMHALFAGGNAGARDFEHFGPWPHLPNWIQADWDLSSEMAASEIRARILK